MSDSTDKPYLERTAPQRFALFERAVAGLILMVLVWGVGFREQWGTTQTTQANFKEDIAEIKTDLKTLRDLVGVDLSDLKERVARLEGDVENIRKGRQ